MAMDALTDRFDNVRTGHDSKVAKDVLPVRRNRGKDKAKKVIVNEKNFKFPKFDSLDAYMDTLERMRLEGADSSSRPEMLEPTKCHKWMNALQIRQANVALEHCKRLLLFQHHHTLEAVAKAMKDEDAETDERRRRDAYMPSPSLFFGLRSYTGNWHFAGSAHFTLDPARTERMISHMEEISAAHNAEEREFFVRNGRLPIICEDSGSDLIAEVSGSGALQEPYSRLRCLVGCAMLHLQGKAAQLLAAEPVCSRVDRLKEKRTVPGLHVIAFTVLRNRGASVVSPSSAPATAAVKEADNEDLELHFLTGEVLKEVEHFVESRQASAAKFHDASRWVLCVG